MNTPSPSIRREFLGWDKPALPEAARRLSVRYARDGELNLGDVIVVLPAKRAGRRLKELLVFLAEDKNLLLTPPLVVTEGKEFPEMLYTPKLPFADELTQDLAWAKALRELPTAMRQHIAPHPPGNDDAVRWLALARVIRRVHVELAADGLDFSAVQKCGPKLADFCETQRWQALVELQGRYLQLLDGLKLWDKQTARLKAIEFREIQTECDVVLLGAVDLNTTLRQMLDLIAARVTAFVIAPESLAERFDAHGCLLPGKWVSAEIPLRDEQLQQVPGPVEQAAAVTDWFATHADKYRNDEMAIGVPDESLVSQVQRQLLQCGVKARWVEGAKVSETSPYRLLAAAVQFAAHRRYEDLASLVRHPDVEKWLRKITGENAGPKASLPAQLDVYFNVCLPSRIHEGTQIGPGKDWPSLQDGLRQIESWLGAASGKSPLQEWGGRFRRILGEIYCDIYRENTLDLNTPNGEFLKRTFDSILEACDRLSALPPSLDTAKLEAADAFQVAIGPLAKEAMPPPADPDAVEILGWLELPLDDSRALIVTSFNDGFVPQSTGADAFLPDRLRRELGVEHNDRRYARDAYTVSVLCHAREQLHFLIARHDANSDPRQPSRLVFSCGDEALVRRARRLFAPVKGQAAQRPPLLVAPGPIPDDSLFGQKAPTLRENPTRFPVTRFKDYIACPYRYYLRHVEKLKCVNDTARELDGGAFGTLIHAALSALGRANDSTKHCEDERRLFDFLDDRLEAEARDRYGADRRRASIRLQVEQARSRLRAFASQQANLIREGWRIEYVEPEETNSGNRGALECAFRVNGESVTLMGRIDRIDYHDQRKIVRVLDYKTADTAQTPEKTHRSGEDWIDLQLPLYRHLWPSAIKDKPKCTVELGYFNLPKRLAETAVQIAAWDDILLQSADEAARKVIHGVLIGKFWPPAYPAPDYSDDFAAICLDNVLSRPRLGDEDDGGAA